MLNFCGSFHPSKVSSLRILIALLCLECHIAELPLRVGLIRGS